MFNVNIELGTGKIVRASAALTDAYVAGTVFSMDRQNFLGLVVNYTKGTESSAQIKIEVSNDSGTTYAQQVTETPSGGTITMALAERSFSATGVYAIMVNPIRANLVKISAKGTGTVSGTMAITAYPAWV